MTTVLIGGAGLLGGAIAVELAARRQPWRVLVRSAQQVGPLRARGAEIVIGDMRDPHALSHALSGARTVITTAQGTPFSRDRSFASIDGVANQELIAAASNANVERFVFISALKADQGAAQVAQLHYKYLAERSLRASGMAYVILRPSSFQETFANGFAPFKRIIELAGIGLTLGRGDGLHSFVAVADVARAAVVALEHPLAHNAIIPVGGPEDLSYRDAYRRITSVTGRRIRRVSLPTTLLRAVGWLATPALPELGDFFAFFSFFDRAGYTCTTPAWLLDALGHRRSFDDAMRAFYAR